MPGDLAGVQPGVGEPSWLPGAGLTGEELLPNSPLLPPLAAPPGLPCWPPVRDEFDAAGETTCGSSFSARAPIAVTATTVAAAAAGRSQP